MARGLKQQRLSVTRYTWAQNNRTNRQWRKLLYFQIRPTSPRDRLVYDYRKNFSQISLTSFYWNQTQFKKKTRITSPFLVLSRRHIFTDCSPASRLSGMRSRDHVHLSFDRQMALILFKLYFIGNCSSYRQFFYRCAPRRGHYLSSGAHGVYGSSLGARHPKDNVTVFSGDGRATYDIRKL